MGLPSFDLKNWLALYTYCQAMPKIAFSGQQDKDDKGFLFLPPLWGKVRMGGIMATALPAALTLFLSHKGRGNP